MARSRRRRAEPVRKGATAFAPSVGRDGRQMGWEAVLEQRVPSDFDVFFPSNVRTSGANNVRFITLIPQNVTRGVVTMLRCRGTIVAYFDSVRLAASFADWPLSISMQLMPVQNGNIVSASILTPTNTADQESNRILWQRLYYPRAGTTITSVGALEVHESNYIELEVDVKSKRRWDRAVWALILVGEVATLAVAAHQVGGTLRGLFKAADGI